jgi:uncharacterized protein YcbK (DUF882 family)
MLPERSFMDKIESLRNQLGFPFPVTSAARCPAYNAKVSGTGATGPHTTGRAIDIAVGQDKALALVRAALFAGFTGVGVQGKGAGRFIHLDDLPNTATSPRPRLWSY